MRDEKPEADVPDGWSVCKRRFTGHFKLVAEYENDETGEKVRVTPYKTYSQPGFANCQRIVYVHPEDGVEEIAAGMEVEHVEDAESVAKRVMEGKYDI
jgi:hypothetical protein